MAAASCGKSSKLDASSTQCVAVYGCGLLVPNGACWRDVRSCVCCIDVNCSCLTLRVCGRVAAGEWQNGYMHGVGTFEAPDGSKYQVSSSYWCLRSGKVRRSSVFPCPRRPGNGRPRGLPFCVCAVLFLEHQ